jgi:hypothetical protein
MDDPSFVRVFQSFDDLPGDRPASSAGIALWPIRSANVGPSTSPKAKARTPTPSSNP